MSSESRTSAAGPAAEWFTPLRFGVLLSLLLVACFPQVLLGGQSFFFRDYGVLGYPFIHHARESFWRGELPLWNPLSNCGAPFLAQWGTMALYPFSLIYLLLPLPWSLSLFSFAHLVLAGVGMYRLANRWVNDGFAASLAGAAFVFNGFTFSCLIWPNYTVALGWMPWVVLLAERAWRGGGDVPGVSGLGAAALLPGPRERGTLAERFGSGGRVVLAALAATMQMLSGVPELVMLTWLLIGALWLVEFIGGRFGSSTTHGDNKPGSGPLGRASVLECGSPLPLSSGQALSESGRGLTHSKTSRSGDFPVAAALSRGRQGCRPSEGKPNLARGTMVVRLLRVVLLTVGLAAAQLLPFFDLLAHSQREHGAIASKWAMPGWGWANLLVPLFHCFETPQGQFFQYGQGFLSSYYLGAGVLVLAGWAVWRARFWRVWLLAGLAGFSLVMALGDATVLYGAFKKLVPVTGLVRYPVKFVALAAFVVPLLAAFGVRRWLGAAEPGKSWRGPALLGGLTLAAMAGLLWLAHARPFRFDQWDVTFGNALWRAGLMVLMLALLWLRPAASGWISKRAGLSVLAVIAFDAATHSPRQNPTLPSSLFRPNVWEEAFKVAPPQFGASRLMIRAEAEQALLHSSVKEHEKNFLGKRLAEWSNLNVLDGIPKVNGSSTLQLREQMQVQTLLYSTTNRLLDGLLDFLGVAQLTTPGTVVEWTPRPGSLPLVTAGQRPLFVEGTNGLGVLAAAAFNPREVVCLPQEIEAQVTVRSRSQAKVLSTNITAHRVECEVEADAPSLVVIAQSFYHLWEAEVDGQPVPLWRANHAFQALETPAGRHRVTVTYRDRNFRAGAAVSLATLLGCGLFCWRRGRPGADQAACDKM